MSPYTSVLLYAGWMMLLTLGYALPRVPQGLSGSKPPDNWERNQPNTDPPVMRRMQHAHLNAVETFPIFVAVVVIAGLKGQLEDVQGPATWVLYARIAQSLVHISGTSTVQMSLRATLFLTQLGLLAAAGYRLL